ncbi:endo-1,4-beta-xylanase [Natronolimnobius sp. AArcel1]|uniref:endo-1,4-beta-xylanase n=1 Tax=Natronolimnobius sp. AArcel1 TaxID=1679093 RepID=UPI0013EA86FB|nr:endo-1,4-beta-xylanase [Natronolimnobius sp. AArcel1]NGM69809.1 endo-1,4-beta-xylanase [Natronolimnobius sp. AArcel1]
MSEQATLRDAADAQEFTIGAALDPNALRVDPSYWKTVAEEFNAVTPENALKMTRLRPSRHTYDFKNGDAIVNFGVENDMYVRGHTLVWHNQKPDWFQAWDYTDEQLRTFLRDHIHTVAGRYRAKIDAWDVVNEAVDDDGSMRRTVWSDGLGEDYIADAFRWADEVTDADLFYNDYGADEINEKSDAIYDLVEGLLEDDVPIDGVGLQLHALGDWPDPESIAENIQRFQELGLEVHITEMDVAFHDGEEPENPLEEQAEYYREVVETCLDVGCDNLVTWGVHDGSSWIRGFKDFGQRYTGDPLLFDGRYGEKPAYDAVKEGLEEY